LPNPGTRLKISHQGITIQSSQFGNQRTMIVDRAREIVGSQEKPKRVKDYAYHKEKMMMCKQAEQGVPLQAEQADWLEDTDEEIDEHELEAHYNCFLMIGTTLGFLVLACTSFKYLETQAS
ncbi:hypothetical protein Tco_0306098, partial [Tanacetum coccineum]